MPRRLPSLPFRLALAILLLAALAILTRTWWLPWFSNALIHEEHPVKADIAVVLAGDPWGARIKKGGDLVREGYVPAALVSGSIGAYEQRDCDLAIAFAVRHGYEAAWFVPFFTLARSTQEEATDIVPELVRRQVRSVLLVTSEYHTGRAYRIYRETIRKLGAQIEVHPVGAPDPDFHADSWWRSREGQKITFTEWTKTIATAFGL